MNIFTLRKNFCSIILIEIYFLIDVWFLFDILKPNSRDKFYCQQNFETKQSKFSPD